MGSLQDSMRSALLPAGAEQKEPTLPSPNHPQGTKMADPGRQGGWPAPDAAAFHGEQVTIARLDPDADVDELYAVSHGSAEFERVWTYLWHGPFADRGAMH